MKFRGKMLRLGHFVCAIVFMPLSADGMINIQGIGVGARPVALAHSYVAVADDPDAVFINPSGLGLVIDPQFSYSTSRSGVRFGDDIGHHILAFAMPLMSTLGVGIGYERISSDLMTESGIFISTAIRPSDFLSLGVTLKYLAWGVDDFDAGDRLSGASHSVEGIDFGAMLRSAATDTQIGVIIQNANGPNTLPSDDPFYSERFRLPTEVHLGFAQGFDITTLTGPIAHFVEQLGIGDVISSSIMITAQYDMRGISPPMDVSLLRSPRTVSLAIPSFVSSISDYSERYHCVALAGEGQISGFPLRSGRFALRAGVLNYLEEDSGGYHLHAGTGYLWNGFQFDYAYSHSGRSHYFSFGFGLVVDGFSRS